MTTTFDFFHTPKHQSRSVLFITYCSQPCNKPNFELQSPTKSNLNHFVPFLCTSALFPSDNTMSDDRRVHSFQFISTSLLRKQRKHGLLSKYHPLLLIYPVPSTFSHRAKPTKIQLLGPSTIASCPASKLLAAQPT